jgi:hypothetical protein
MDFEGGAMTSKLCTAAAVFALLTVAAPAHAYTIAIESLDLNFGNGYQETGNLGISVSKFPFVPCCEFPTLSFNGSPIPVANFASGEAGRLYQFSQPIPSTTYLLAFNSANFPNYTFSDFSLNGVTAVSGDVSVASVSSLPLPAALPLFGSALLGLAGFAAARKSRRGSCKE